MALEAIVTHWLADLRSLGSSLMLAQASGGGQTRGTILHDTRTVLCKVKNIWNIKLHDKISRALTTHTEAISRALNEYNAAAATLNPPQDQLIWAAIIQMVILAQREAGLLYFGIKHSCEEIRKLNIKTTCIITFMINKHADSTRLSVHGFMGSLFSGRHLSHDPALITNCPLLPWATGSLGLQQIVMEYEEDNYNVDRAWELVRLDTDNTLEVHELNIKKAEYWGKSDDIWQDQNNILICWGLWTELSILF
ncbi:hypothetical protein C8J57DRAFT_1219537 [Mycena rebaudengoi]|nr:hypothetical protein C8J57DRAFT_1219537 [Mycena rebaudengoi]